MKKNALIVLIAFALVFSFSMGTALDAKDTTKESKVKEETCSHKDLYCCPQEGCTYKSDKPGKCPHCGVELKKFEHKVLYVCPMKQCNVKSDKPGKCPKCGMELKQKVVCCKTEKECKHEHEHKHDH
jgi:hypothetical protein